MLSSKNAQNKLQKLQNPLLFTTFVICVIVLSIIHPSYRKTILPSITIIISFLVLVAIQNKKVNSKIKQFFNTEKINSKIKQFFLNEKIFVIALFFVSIVCRIFFINSRKVAIDVVQDIKAVNFIVKNGISAYFANYSALLHIGPQYPPLYPLLLAVIFPFGVSLKEIKLFTVIVGSLIIIPTYFIGKALYDRRKASLSALLMFALPYPFLISLQGINDIPVTFISALYMYFFILYIKNSKNYDGILAGTFLGLGMLFKYTLGIFYLSTLLFALFYKHDKEKKVLYKAIFVIFVSLLFVIPWIIYMYYTGLLEMQIAYLSELSEPGRNPNTRHGYQTRQWFRFLFWSIVLLSPTNIVLLLLLISYVFYRRKGNWKYFLLFSWVITPFIFYGILHPLIRYWMISFPALTLLIANSIEDLNKESDRLNIFFTTFVCSLALCLLVSYVIVLVFTGRWFFQI